MKETQYRLVMLNGVVHMVNIESGKNSLPYRTKPLPEPILTYHHLGLVALASG